MPIRHFSSKIYISMFMLPYFHTFIILDKLSSSTLKSIMTVLIYWGLCLALRIYELVGQGLCKTQASRWDWYINKYFSLVQVISAEWTKSYGAQRNQGTAMLPAQQGAHRGDTKAGGNTEYGILSKSRFVFNIRLEHRNLWQAEVIQLKMRMRPEVSGCQTMKNLPGLL